MIIPYLIDIVFTEPAFENQISDLFDLVRLRFVSFGLKVENSGITPKSQHRHLMCHSAVFAEACHIFPFVTFFLFTARLCLTLRLQQARLKEALRC